MPRGRCPEVRKMSRTSFRSAARSLDGPAWSPHGREAGARRYATEGTDGSAARLDRRALLGAAGASAGGLGLGAMLSAAPARADTDPTTGWFNVQSTPYGAVGDGTTDDTAAIQHAIEDAKVAGGGVVYLPPCSGGYLVNTDTSNPYNSNKGLTLYSGITLLGSGYAGRIKRAGDYTRAGSRLIRAGRDEVVIGMSIRDLYVDGNPVDVTSKTALGSLVSACIRLEEPPDFSPPFPAHERIRVDDCTIVNWPGAAMSFVSTQDFVVSGNLIVNAYRGSIVFFLNSGYGAVVGNTVREGRDDCIAVQANTTTGTTGGWDPPQQIAIVGNHLASGLFFGSAEPANNGISVQGLIDSTIDGNVVHGAGAMNKGNIKVDSIGEGDGEYFPRRLLISGNRCLDSSAYGIRVGSDQAEDVTIATNMVSGSQLSGIYVEVPSTASALRNIAIADNEVIDCGADRGANDHDGIRVRTLGGAGGRVIGLFIDRNHVVRPQRSAIVLMGDIDASLVTLDGNVCEDPNMSGVAVVDAITLRGLDRFDVTGNRIFKTDRGTGQCRWGLNLLTGCTNGTVAGTFAYRRDFSGSAEGLAPAIVFGSGVLDTEGGSVTDNGLHKVDPRKRLTNGGAVTITAGSGTIAHGLIGTPKTLGLTTRTNRHVAHPTIVDATKIAVTILDNAGRKVAGKDTVYWQAEA
jgi:pectate lyase-like protein